jgi:hypothetical protein
VACRRTQRAPGTELYSFTPEMESHRAWNLCLGRMGDLSGGCRQRDVRWVDPLRKNLLTLVGPGRVEMKKANVGPHLRPNPRHCAKDR